MLPPLILLCLGLIWGGTTVVAKYVGMSGVPSLGYAFWVTFGAGVLLLGIGRLRGKTLPLTAAHVRYYLVCGLLGSAIPTMDRKVTTCASQVCGRTAA